VISVLSGGAIAPVVRLYRYLEASMAGRPFEVEVSADETESPTTNAQHVYIAHELRRLGVGWVRISSRSALPPSLPLRRCAQVTR
jgi:tagaturonate epimerase